MSGCLTYPGSSDASFSPCSAFMSPTQTCTLITTSSASVQKNVIDSFLPSRVKSPNIRPSKTIGSAGNDGGLSRQPACVDIDFTVDL